MLERVATGLSQTTCEVFAHEVKEDRSRCVSFGQWAAGMRQLTAAVEQGIADSLEDCDLP